MIEFIKTWGTGLVCAAVLGAICNILLPNHSIAKSARVLVGIYMAIALVAPLLKSDLALPEEIQVSIETTYGYDLYDEAVLRETANHLETAVVGELDGHNVSGAEVTATLGINDEGSIVCQEISITLDETFKNRQTEIVLWVKELCGMTPVLYFRG